MSYTSINSNRLLSPCHDARIFSLHADGVLTGCCEVCQGSVVRINRRTGLQEWLDGKSPWTTAELRPVDDEHQNPEVLAFLPVFGLRSPCHLQPVVFQDVLGIKVGVCATCSRIFARVNPDTGRVERVVREQEIKSPEPLTEFSEAFQPRR